MSFKYEYIPLDDQANDKKDRPLLKDGPGSFEVKEAVIHTSKAGNEMIKLTLKTTDSDNRKGLIWDYLANPYKIKYFLDSINMSHLYNATGTLEPTALIGSHGKCEIKIEESQQYGNKNAISKYIAYAGQQMSYKGLNAQNASKVLKAKEDDFDDIPF